MKRKKVVYKSPKITSKKIKTSFFFNNSPFYDSFEELLIPNVFASGSPHGDSNGEGSSTSPYD